MTLLALRTLGATLSCVLACTACGESDDKPSGTLRVTARAPEQAFTTSDGWSVQLSALQVSVRDLRLGGLTIGGPRELTLTTNAEALLGEGQLTVGSYSGASFTIERVQLAGSATREGVEKQFDWSFEERTSYVRCANQTEVPDNAEATLQIGVRPEVLFRDSLASTSAPLLFQPVADADSDEDGEIEGDELWERDTRGYDTGTRRDIATLWEFIEALVKQLGHVDGDARCEVAES